MTGTTHLYHAEIDGGQGGETTIKAASLKEAMAKAIEWADGGDWPEEGCAVEVRVTSAEAEDDYAVKTVEIPSAAARQDAELDEDGEVIASSRGEWSTHKIVVHDGEAYLMHDNGGSRGAYDRMDGDGVWRSRPVTETRKIDRDEARCLMLDWGCSPAEVARETRKITD